MRSERGFTLIEIMVSIGIFGIVAAMMATSFSRLMHTTYDNEIRSGAYNAAQEVLDQLRSTDPATMPSTGSAAAASVVVGARTFSTVVTYCADASLCPTTTTRHVRVQVSYRGSEIYAVDTIFSQLE